MRPFTIKAVVLTLLSKQCFSAYRDVAHIDGLISDSQTNGIRDLDTSQGSWTEALEQAKNLVHQMTLEEQNNLTFGYTSDRCAGLTGSATRVGISPLCLQDGPAGVRGADLVNGYAGGISVAAGWNPDLAYERGLYMGQEFKAKGVHIALSPVVEPMGRVALGGRNWEGFGPDPYLSGKLAATTVQGLQKSVIANIKHYVGYEQETNRNPHGLVAAISSDIDDRTMHELYLWPFQDTVRADVGSVMCSYNRINGTYACENDATLNKLLKDELAFQGPVITDFLLGQQSGIPSAKAGLDMAMPVSHYWHNNKLAKAVRDGDLSAARLADMAIRILAPWFKFLGGPDSDFPAAGHGLSTNQLAPHLVVDARNPEAKQSILRQAIEGHVLVKNQLGALPLRKPKFLSLYGYDATIFRKNYPGSSSLGKWAFGLEPTTESSAELLLGFATGHLATAPETATLGTLTIGAGSGANSASFIIDPYAAIARQAEEDDTFVLWDFDSTNPPVNPATDACLVFINEFAQEGVDRFGLADPVSDRLVTNVASKCPNTIVVIHNAGIRLVDEWINNPNVTATIFAHLPGQTSGQALIEILYGRSSPSGRLPYTVARKAEDYGELLKPSRPLTSGLVNPQSKFTEGVNIDYRYFLSKNIKPRFPFGYGLTYSEFSYSKPTARWLSSSGSGSDFPPLPPNPKNKAPGGIKSLFTPIASVSVTVSNIGSTVAAEVAQLYVQDAGEKRVRFLRGFQKVELVPGETRELMFELTRRDLSRWNTKKQSWELQKGMYSFHVGPNVEDIAVKTRLKR